MLVEYNKSIAYICPYCGRLTERDISLFDLPKNGAVFSCSEKSCGAKVVTISSKKDKYIAEVLCTACGEKHRFTLKHSSFWRKELLVLTCPETTVDIMFIGEKERIEDELKKQNALYREAEAEICANPEISIYFDIIREINNIAKNNKIVCAVCGSGDFDLELTDEGVLISCRDCSAQKIIPVSVDSLMELLETGTIVLGDK